MHHPWSQSHCALQVVVGCRWWWAAGSMWVLPPPHLPERQGGLAPSSQSSTRQILLFCAHVCGAHFAQCAQCNYLGVMPY